jgi:hypothetical protein
VNKPPSTQTPGRGGEPARAENSGEARTQTQERAPRPVRPERAQRPERPRVEGGEHHGEGRGRRRRGRRERGSGTEVESARPNRTPGGAERDPKFHQPAPSDDAGVLASQAALWAEPALPASDRQAHVLDAIENGSTHEPVMAEQLPPTGERDHEVKADRETVLVATPIGIAMDDTRRQVLPEREAISEETETQSAKAMRTVPTFELPSDLIQVETSPGKRQPIQDNSPPEAAERFEGRARRPRPLEEPPTSEPLVQVETRH